MFAPTLQGQGTEEQKQKWLGLANDYKILGTYAQTELGHGKQKKSFKNLQQPSLHWKSDLSFFHRDLSSWSRDHLYV